MRHLLPVLCLILTLGHVSAAAPEFPKEIAGLTLEKVTDFEKSDPGGGTGWSYRSPSAKADIYLYTLGIPSVPSDLDAPLLSEHMLSLIESLYIVEQRGYYSQVQTVLKGEKTAIGQIPVWHAELTYTEEGIPRVSHIYLGAIKGEFFKIRYTYLASGKENEEKRLNEFLQGLGKVL